MDAYKQAAINLYVWLRYEQSSYIFWSFNWKILWVGTKFLSLIFPMYLNFRFLGYFQPQVGKPALWEPESGDEHVLDDETR